MEARRQQLPLISQLDQQTDPFGGRPVCLVGTGQSLGARIPSKSQSMWLQGRNCQRSGFVDCVCDMDSEESYVKAQSEDRSRPKSGEDAGS